MIEGLYIVSPRWLWIKMTSVERWFRAQTTRGCFSPCWARKKAQKLERVNVWSLVWWVTEKFPAVLGRTWTSKHCSSVFQKWHRFCTSKNRTPSLQRCWRIAMPDGLPLLIGAPWPACSTVLLEYSFTLQSTNYSHSQQQDCIYMYMPLF